MNMHKLIIAAAFLFLISCKGEQDNSAPAEKISPDLLNNPATANPTDAEKKLPAFEFAESTFDFGSIKSGTEITHEYHFRNSGNADLLISEASGSCGCTVPEWPKNPISPGDEGVIKVTFNSTGMSGQIAKTVTILANTIPSTKVLTISGEVVK